MENKTIKQQIIDKLYQLRMNVRTSLLLMK